MSFIVSVLQVLFAYYKYSVIICFLIMLLLWLTNRREYVYGLFWVAGMEKVKINEVLQAMDKLHYLRLINLNLFLLFLLLSAIPFLRIICVVLFLSLAFCNLEKTEFLSEIRDSHYDSESENTIKEMADKILEKAKAKEEGENA